MVRYAVITAIALFSLSCASSGSIVRYNVYCPQKCGWSSVSYLGADGMEHAKALNDWSHSVVSESGERFVFTVQRGGSALRVST